jgi:hypothetical protein
MRAPSAADGSARSGVRFHTATVWPAASRSRTIAEPILPKPRNAIFIEQSSPLRPRKGAALASVEMIDARQARVFELVEEL